MNKHVTLLILVVVLCAMGLVLVLHTQSTPETLTAQSQGEGSPATGQDTGTGEPGDSSQTPADTTQPGLSAESGEAGPAATQAGQEQGSTAAATPAETQPQTGQTQAPAESASSAQPSGGTTAQPVTPAEAQPQPQAQTQPQPQTQTPAGTNASSAQSAATPPATGSSIKPGSLSLTGNHTLKSISLHFDGSTRMRLHIEANDPFPCKTFVLADPQRLVIDLPGTWKGMKAPDVPQNKLINGVRTGSQKAGPRLVLDMSKAPKYEVTRPSDNVVDIFIQ